MAKLFKVGAASWTRPELIGRLAFYANGGFDNDGCICIDYIPTGRCTFELVDAEAAGYASLEAMFDALKDAVEAHEVAWAA